MSAYSIGMNIKKLRNILCRIFRIKTTTGSLSSDVSNKQNLGERGYRPERRAQMLRKIEAKHVRALQWLH